MTPTPSLTRRNALGLIAAPFVVPRIAMAGAVEVMEGEAFGTSWRIVSAPGTGLAGLRGDIDALFAEIDRSLSPWRSDSAISRFNLGLADEHASDTAIIEVTQAALEIARLSKGAFDPTVGPLVSKWGFGPIEGGAPDWRGISASAGAIRKQRADLTLDLCGIAKGWALDRARILVEAAGVRHALLELGGEFATIGHHPDRRDWRVAVESTLHTRLRLPPKAAVATSGTDHQSYVAQGRLWSHIIDPAQEEPVSGGLRSVTVVAQDATTADGWATALLAAGEIEGPDIAAAQSIAALFLIEERGAVRQHRTRALSDFIL